jgi:hypothetical protein
VRAGVELLQSFQHASLRAVEADAVPPSVRKLLELDLRRLADEGHIPARGEREVRIRLDEAGRIRWFEPSRVRVPASELEA